MWVKICGNTNLDDALQAMEAGADALGFVFAPSPRKVTVEQVRRIVPHLSQRPSRGVAPHGVETFGVFVDATADEIVRAVVECGLDGVQLHGGLDAGLAAQLRRRFLALHLEMTKIVSVLTFDATLAQQLELAARHGDAVLVDSRSAARVGGTGQNWDWSQGSAAFRGAAGKVRVIAAGGLNPANVEEAIETLTPWGVDVVTGVEARPGRKDWRRVEEFVAAAKGARLTACVQ